MGTSASSLGPGHNVSFDPPWLDGLIGEFEQDNDNSNTNVENPIIPPDKPNEIAPKNRFGAARRNVGSFFKDRESGTLSKALGHYSKTGMGGASNLTKRMRLSITVGANLYSLFQNIRDSKDDSIAKWLSSLSYQQLSPPNFINEVIKILLFDGGSVDEESCKNSISLALSEFLENNPDADLKKLPDDDIMTIVEFFISEQVFDRFMFDMGPAFEKKEYDPLEIIQVKEEIKDFIDSYVSSEIRKMRQNKNVQSKKSLKILLEKAIENTFKIFEASI